MDPTAVERPQSGISAYLDACDLEDEILGAENVRAWAEEFAGNVSFEEDSFVLRGVGGGGERLVGALSYIGSLRAEVAARNTDYRGRKVVLIFTAAVSPVGLDREAAHCRALGADTIEAWGCSAAFDERKTDLIDALRLIQKCGTTYQRMSPTETCV